MEQFKQLATEFWHYLPYLVGGIAVLVVGWLVAWLLAGITRKLVARTRVDDRLGTAMGKQASEQGRLANWVAAAVFWIILSLSVIGALSVLQLGALSESLRQAVDAVMRYVPQLIAAGVLLLVAWITAEVLRWIIVRALEKTNLERRLGVTGRASATAPGQEAAGVTPSLGDRESAIAAPRGLAKSMGDVVYWLVFLLFLPAILGALAIQGILGPVQSMVDKVLAFLPNILVAVVILALGWFFASILRRIVIGILTAVGADRLGQRIGLKSEPGQSGSISHVVGWTVFLLVLIPVFLAALDALQLQALTRPTSEMLGRVLNAVPSIFAAGLVLVIAYVVGRIVSQLVTKILESARFDALPAKLGLGETASESQWAPSRLAGYLVLIAILLFATVTSLELLGFAILSGILTNFLHLAGRILLGLVIFAFGLFLARIVGGAIASRQKKHTQTWSLAAQIGIMFLAGAMALRQMGLADEIISLAFGLTFGAAAVAAAIAFGLGGRDLAGRKL
ncbi:MAG: mechanosensitive ion channel, partial [Planctomycetota bacterium]